MPSVCQACLAFVSGDALTCPNCGRSCQSLDDLVPEAPLYEGDRRFQRQRLTGMPPVLAPIATVADSTSGAAMSVGNGGVDAPGVVDAAPMTEAHREHQPPDAREAPPGHYVWLGGRRVWLEA